MRAALHLAGRFTASQPGQGQALGVFTLAICLLLGGVTGVAVPLLGLESGLAAVALCLTVLVLIAAAWYFGAAANGGGRATLIFVGVMVFIVDATFRQREITAQGIDWQTLLKLSVWVGALVIALRNTERPVNALFGDGIRWLTMFSLLAVLSTVYSLTPAYTFGAGVSALAYCAIAVCLLQRFDRKAILGAVLAGLSALLLVSLLVYLAGYGRAVMEGGTVVRVGGIAGSPNGLGRAAALTLLVVGVLKLQYRRSILNWRLFVPLAMALVCLVLSDSRTSVAAVVFAFGLHYARRWMLKAFFAFVLGGAVLALLVMFEIDWRDIGSMISRTGKVTELTTLTGRTDIWAASWNAFLERPILGYGFGATKVLLPEIYRAAWGFTVTHTHNMLLQAAVTTGLVGLAFIGMTLLRQVVEYVREPNMFQTVVLGYMVIQGLTEPGPLGTAPNLIALFWALALCWHSARDARLPSAGAQQ